MGLAVAVRKEYNHATLTNSRLVRIRGVGDEKSMARGSELWSWARAS